MEEVRGKFYYKLHYNIPIKKMSKETLKEGFLVKRGHVRKNWKSRWFKLSALSLRYYKENGSSVPKGRISFDGATLHRSVKSCNRKFVFLITTTDGVEYWIQAQNSTEFTQWTNAIEDCIFGTSETKIDEEEENEQVITNNNLEIRRESKVIKGYYYSGGFTGFHLRLWMERALKLSGCDAALTVSSLLRLGLIQEQTNSDGDPFADDKYYRMLVDEQSLKNSCSHSISSSVSSGSSLSVNNSSPSKADDDPFTETEQEYILPIDLPNSEIIKRGTLVKRGHIVASWKVRGFVLQNDPPSLSYYDITKSAPKIIRSLEIAGATAFVLDKTTASVALHIQNPPDNMLCLKLSCGTIYVMHGSCESEINDWVEKINTVT